MLIPKDASADTTWPTHDELRDADRASEITHPKVHDLIFDLMRTLGRSYGGRTSPAQEWGLCLRDIERLLEIEQGVKRLASGGSF